jgi:hypothetical protein
MDCIPLTSPSTSMILDCSLECMLLDRHSQKQQPHRFVNHASIFRSLRPRQTSDDGSIIQDWLARPPIYRTAELSSGDQPRLHSLLLFPIPATCKIQLLPIHSVSGSIDGSFIPPSANYAQRGRPTLSDSARSSSCPRCAPTNPRLARYGLLMSPRAHPSALRALVGCSRDAI